MAIFSIPNVRIAGVSSCVPENEVDNTLSNLFDNDEERDRYIENTGVISRRVAPENMCSSDLCYSAAEKLIECLGWDKSSIDGLIFISQTGDYIYPATACILQARLGLKTSCMSFDITLGCSGWVYGLSVASSLIQSGAIKRILLLNGETVSKTRSPFDRVNMITGDAGTVTALEYRYGFPSMYFDMNTDGTGYQTIIIPDGGYRNMVSDKSLAYHPDEDGVLRNNLQTKMDGAGVFAFAISRAPKSIINLCSVIGITDEDIDYYLLHQANKMIINKIGKKIGGGKKVVSNIEHFGNTSSTSIPLLITCKLSDSFANKRNIACAFGVGLSWATVFFQTDGGIICPALISI